jgi:histidine phosphotransferase ChpT
MASTVDIRVLELLCARLCHELISPVSAINNGIELMDEDAGDMLGEIIALLAHSSGQASRRLMFYRVAYGYGGAAVESLGLADAGALVKKLVEGEKVTVAWPDSGEVLGRRATKVLLNLALLGIEALPRGGEMAVSVTAGAEVDIAIAATGEGAGLRDECLDALGRDADIDALSPRSVQAYFTRHLVAAAGGSFELAPGDGGSITLKARLPKPV